MTPSRRSCPLCKGDTWNRQCPRCGGKGNVAAPAPDAPAARPPVVTLSWGEYESLRRALDEATARAVRCEGVDTERFNVLWRSLPFHIRHRYGGDEREAREGVDVLVRDPELVKKYATAAAIL